MPTLLRPLPNGTDCSAIHTFLSSFVLFAGKIIISPLHELPVAATPLLLLFDVARVPHEPSAFSASVNVKMLK